jgi:hypothetical protein
VHCKDLKPYLGTPYVERIRTERFLVVDAMNTMPLHHDVLDFFTTGILYHRKYLGVEFIISPLRLQRPVLKKT